MRLLAAALLLAFCLPAMAQEKKAPNVNTAATGTKGSVAQMALAYDLYALGLARKDALTVLTAAKLAAGVEVKPVEQKKTTTGTAIADQQDGATAPVDAATMMATARALAGEDELLAGLVDDAELETTRDRLSGATASPSRLPAGQTDTWEVPFYADSYAEIAVLGDGDANLDVLVTDENGNTICYDVSWSDTIYCDFIPAWNGYFTVTVQNNGKRPNSYSLMTN
jgi:hypothetical protein